MARALIVLPLLALLTSGCVSNGGGGDKSDIDATASPSRYSADPDKPKRVCESTMIGNEPKTICY